ncbi:MAG: hypothetical protein Q7T74_05785 [Candidatus Saccharibacteria bacterium]|nr:hypothetical protein [Candidatus Saccharibacteria bacterium]
MKPFFKFIVIVSIIPLITGLYFFDNIKGYYQFKQYCAKEGGLRIATPLEKNVGWLADDYWDARTAFLLDHVAFVRYTDKEDGKTYDLQYFGGNQQKDSSYNKSIADESKSVIYKWVYVNDQIAGELRLGRFGYAILDSNSNGVLSRYYGFSYLIFDRSKAPLDSKSVVDCFFYPAQHKGEVDGWVTALNSGFRN